MKHLDDRHSLGCCPPLQITWLWDSESSNALVFVVSVDGVHCKINEPRKEPSAKWYSHKHAQAGLVYELGVAVFESKIVWINGPFEASKSDITIFRKGLVNAIPENAKAIGDRGYRKGGKKITTRNTLDKENVKTFKRRVRGRHENLNARIKSFKCMAENFRHGKDKHSVVFEAICVCVQFDMENGHPLWDV